MSSGENKIVQSVEDVISAVGILLNDIRSNPDLGQEQKELAMEKVGAVTEYLKDIHGVLFVREMEETQSLADPLVVTNLTESFSQALYSKTDQLDEQDNDADAPEPTKLRLVVTSHNTHEEDQDEQEQTKKVAKTPDNLGLIQGIDEQTQAVLKEQEIFHFDEIAAFNEADVVRISNSLGDPYRVARENWIEQAALLAKDVKTKYSLTLEGQADFDRLSWVSAYNWQEPKFEQAKDNEVVHEEPLSHVSDQAQVALTQEQVLKEKALLEAELASLREQLSAQTRQASEMEANENSHDPFEEDIALSPRLQKAFEEPVAPQEEDVSQESSVYHNSEPEEVQDGAMWHEEVSLAPDYVPPIVDEDEGVEPDVDEAHAAEPDSFESQDREMPAEFIEDGDIALPHTRQRQDEFVNKAYAQDAFAEQNQEGEQDSFEEPAPDPYLQRDLSSFAETFDSPEHSQESAEHFAAQENQDLDEQRPAYIEQEPDAPPQPVQPEGRMPPPIPVMNGTPPLPPHTRPPMGQAGVQGGQHLMAMASNTGHQDGLQNPALRQMDQAMSGQENQPLVQNGAPQPPAPPVPPSHMSQHPGPHHPQGLAGQMPLPQGHPAGQYATGIPPRAPAHRPIHGTPLANGQHLQHPRPLPPGGPAHLPPQDLRQERPLDAEQQSNEFTHLDALNGQPQEKKKKPEVSAGFRLKAKQFAESLQRSFSGKDE